MAKKLKILSAALMAGAVIVPVAYVHASNVEITVNVAAVAEIARVEEKPTDLGGKEYIVTVKTNSIKGYDLYASADGENWENVRVFSGYPKGDDLKSTVKTTGNSPLKFKVTPKQ